MQGMSPAVLDNVVWHSLHTVHAPFAEHRGGAVRFPADVAIFGAVPDVPSPADWDDLASLVGASGVATLLRARVDEPRGWERAMTVPALQMVATDVEGAYDDEVVALGPTDAGEMVDLAARTKPGPFGPRTPELGGYVGLRDDDGRLVAMAGHRLRVPGFVEVSAVCTDESQRGRGLGSRLVRHVVATAAGSGDTVFLHVMTDNLGAIRLYEALGFETRARVEAVALVAPSEAGSAPSVPAAADLPLDACRVD